ncbi:MAG: outer membrane beta-barrel protein [Bacteroidaceae bacterium]|nr:outer membrane beta-barrel protein [Bacteroidaceae bacterium]
MKKVILAALVAVASLSANAQVYLGGTLGFNAGKAVDGADNTTKFQIAPEVGYSFNEKWAVGLAISFTTANGDFNENGFPTSATKYGKSSTVFGFSPYARYTFAKTGIASFFLDGGVGFNFYNNDGGTAWQIGVRPGVKLSASEKVDFVAQLGYLGYAKASKGQGKGNMFGLNVDNTAIKFGVYYNF